MQSWEGSDNTAQRGVGCVCAPSGMMNAVKQCIITEINDEILVTLQGHQKNSSDRIIIPIKYLIGSFISYDEDVCTPTNRRSLQMR